VHWVFRHLVTGARFPQMRAWILVPCLTACAGAGLHDVALAPVSVVGVWQVEGPATAADPSPVHLDRFNLAGELVILGACADPETKAATSTVCNTGQQAWYGAAGRVRPKGAPPCARSVVRAREDSDSVVIVLAEDTDHLRRELRGRLVGDRLVGMWAGATYAGSIRGTFVLRRMPGGSGLTRACS
jgi:hypothetical protein